MKFLLLLILCAGVYCQNGREQCYTRNGSPGVCSNYQNCKQAVEDYRRGVQVAFCPFNRNLICCAIQQQNSGGDAQPVRLPQQQSLQPSGQRISERKCQEYSKATKKVDVVQSLSLFATQQAYESFKCEYQSTGLVTGGQVTKLGEFPHMAVIGWYNNFEQTYEFFCGGSLISENFVLTAAHCYVQRGNPKSYPQIVRFGVQNLKSRNGPTKDVRIQQFILHENYNPKLKKNDIALIQLGESLQFNNYIRPACVWQASAIQRDSALITGFGSTGYGNSGSEELMKALVGLKDTSECNTKYARYGVDFSQLCAGGGSNDTCQGDSGGPIQIQSADNVCIYYIIGITSYGDSICGYSPGVYTRVSHFIDWIERRVWA